MQIPQTNPKIIISIVVLLLVLLIGGYGVFRINIRRLLNKRMASRAFPKLIKRESQKCGDAKLGRLGNDVFIPPPNATSIRIPEDAESIRENFPEMVDGDTLWLTDDGYQKLSAYGYWTESFVCNIAEYSEGRIEVIKPKAGDRLDPETMEPDVDLTAECEVNSVVSLGLMDANTGKVICKAFVTVKQI